MKKVVFALLLMLPLVSFAQIRYEKSFEINSEIGLKENECLYYYIGAEMINGISFSPIFSCGLGVGMGTGKYDYEKVKMSSGSVYHIESKNTLFLPTYVRAKLNFTKKRVSPFAAVNIGYIFDLGDTSLVNANSLLLEADLGLDVNFNKDSKLYFMFGYTNRKSEIYIRHDISHTIIADRSTGMICFRIGYAF